MNINVQIQLGNNESASDLAGNATEIANKILEAVGGDPSKDIVSVQINDMGMAGNVPPPPGPMPPTDPILTVINSTFATNNAPPPGDKQTRTNATAQSDVTAVYVDIQSTEGDDISELLLGLVVGDPIEIRGVADTSRYAVFTLTAPPIDQTDYVEFSVSFVEGAGAFTNSACTISFTARP
jgi:hypothetical protein